MANLSKVYYGDSIPKMFTYAPPPRSFCFHPTDGVGCRMALTLLAMALTLLAMALTLLAMALTLLAT
eukprot:81828-Rhodomonas_salina.1